MIRKYEKDEMGLKRERKKGIIRDTQLIGGNRRNIEKEWDRKADAIIQLCSSKRISDQPGEVAVIRILNSTNRMRKKTCWRQKNTNGEWKIIRTRVRWPPSTWLTLNIDKYCMAVVVNQLVEQSHAILEVSGLNPNSNIIEQFSTNCSLEKKKWSKKRPGRAHLFKNRF